MTKFNWESATAREIGQRKGYTALQKRARKKALRIWAKKFKEGKPREFPSQPASEEMIQWLKSKGYDV